VDPTLPCCKGGGGSSGGSGGSGGSRAAKPKAGGPELPDRPNRTDISKGIGRVRGRVISCGDKHSFKGTVTVKFAISSDGDVSKASANKGSSAFKDCVTDAVKNAHFTKSERGLTVDYPFVFR
jgi:hypothetical protein